GADSEDVLRKAGITSGGKLAQMVLGRLPKAALMVVNKAVAFRISTLMGARTLGRLGRFVPVVGGFVGAGLDAYLISRIAHDARAHGRQQRVSVPQLRAQGRPDLGTARPVRAGRGRLRRGRPRRLPDFPDRPPRP